MTARLVALGDSTSCGEGVGLRIPASATWPALLAEAVPGGRLRSLATPGARVRDVLATQVRRAVEEEPSLVTLLVGLNDVWRAGFQASSYAADLSAVLQVLAPTGAPVLLGRLHDPCVHLPLPPALRRAVLARVAEINAVVDRVASPQVHVLDLASVDGLRLRQAFDLDRLHPNTAGHALMARQAAHVLRRHGMPVGATTSVPLPASPSRGREGRWLLRDGLPWLAGHVPHLLLARVGAGHD